MRPTSSLPSPAIRPASGLRYGSGVAITVVAVLSQYVVPQAFPFLKPFYGSLLADLAIVYGIPLASFLVLVGPAPLRDWNRRMAVAAWQGLRWYGGLSILALAIVMVLAVVYLTFDPSALGLLQRPNPVLSQASGDPWFFVGLSFVIGAFEETIFRGFVFGYWRDRPGSWFVPATWTSAVFAGVHLYYGATYGAAAPLIYPTLFLMGFAFAATYRFSGGNLVVPAALHGASDATAFLSLVSTELGIALHYLIIAVGGGIALVHYLRSSGARSAPIAPPPPRFA